MTSRLAPCLLFVPLLAGRSVADDDYTRTVRPIFAAHCVKCHGPQKQRGGLRLDQPVAALKGGDSGPAIVPGKAADSPLLRRVGSRDRDERMPPTGEPLSREQIAALRAWNDQGAKSSAAVVDPLADHWAFRK